MQETEPEINPLFPEDLLMSAFLSPLQRNLISLLEEEGPLSRKRIVEKLDTPRTTVYDNLLKLQERHIVAKFSRQNGKRGRPRVFWKLEV